MTRKANQTLNSEAGIKPQFVFNGLNLVRKDKPFASSDGRIVKRSTAWTDYAKGKIDSAAANFSSAGWFSYSSLCHLSLVLCECH